MKNTINMQCGCGRSFNFPSTAAGRRARCKTCGRIFTVEAESADAVTPLEKRADPAADALRSAATSPPLQPSARRPEPATTRAAVDFSRRSSLIGGSDATATARTRSRRRGFWSDAFSGLAFWKQPANLIALAVLSILASLADLIPIWLISLPILGVVYGYYMEVIVASAGGDDDLPEFDDWDGVWASAVLPFFRFVGTSLALAVPVIVGSVWMQAADVPDQSAKTITIGLAAFGVFLWPVGILAVSLGGLSVFVRVDLLLRTILSAFVPYLAVWMFLLLAATLQILSAAVGLVSLPDSVRAALGGAIPSTIIANFITCYMMIVAMRTIGLFYRHFKDRFPWSAG